MHVELTPAGSDLIEPLFARHAGDITAAMAALSGEELRQLSDLLRRLGLAAESETLEVGLDDY